MEEQKAENRGAVALVLDLAKAFERVSLLVWAWATHFSFQGRYSGCCAVISSTRGECSSPRMVRSQTRDSIIFQEVGAKSKNLKEGVEVANNILSLKTGVTSVCKWESEKHKCWCIKAESFKATLPRTALCRGTLACGEHVVGQWYSWITMKNWGLCMGCTAQRRQNSKFSAPSRGRS